MVRGERALLGVDRDERHLREGVLTEGGRVAGGVALVVVPYLFLFHDDCRDKGQRPIAVVGGLQVEQEVRDRVAIVDDGPFNA